MIVITTIIIMVQVGIFRDHVLITLDILETSAVHTAKVRLVRK